MGGVYKVFLLIGFILLEIKLIKSKLKKIINFFENINLINFLFSKTKNNIFKNNDINHFLNKNIKNNKTINNSQKKKILVELLLAHHSEPMIINILIAKDLMKIYDAEIVGLVNQDDILTIKIAESFGIKKFIYKDKINFYTRLNYFFKAISKIDLKYPHKVKYIKINKHDEVGKAAYEHYLRYHDCEINKINILLLINCLAKALEANNFSNKIFFKNYIIFVIGETQFIPNKLYFNKSLLLKTPIYTWTGSAATNYIGRLYKNYKDRNSSKRKISKINAKLLLNILGKKRNILKIIKQKKGLEEIGKETVWSNRKPSQEIKFYSRAEFCKYFNFEDGKKNVLILPHAMADNVFNNEWNIFNTSYDWFLKTCKSIKNLDEVNWLIKPHPYEYKFNTIKAENVFNYAIRQPKENIKFLKEGIHINNIYKYVDAVLTCNGSAGFEYTSLGIPTITTADSDYSNFGFTIAPKNKKKYFSILKNISKIRKLNNINKLKAQTYWVSTLSLIYNSHNFCPRIKQHGFFKKKLFFKLLANKNKNSKKNNFSKDITFQLNNNNRHSINYEFTKKNKKYNFCLNDAG
jgi:hypothetical protein